MTWPKEKTLSKQIVARLEKEEKVKKLHMSCLDIVKMTLTKLGTSVMT